MKHLNRLGAIAALAALTLAGCERSADDLVLGPHAGPASAVARAPSAPPADTARATTTPGVIALTDAIQPQVWYDAEGHAYQVTNVIDADGNIVTQHRRDGVLFATAQSEGAGVTIGVYDQGSFIQDQFIVLGGPQATRALGEGTRPPAERPGDGTGRPMRQMIMPCTDELNAYIIASGAMIAAAYNVTRNPTSLKAKKTFLLAIGTFALAWRELYECESNAAISG